MKIAVISSTVFAVPLKGYGGLEAIAWEIARGLVAKGHEISLIAPDGSECPGAQIIPTGPPGQHDEKMAYGGYPEHREGDRVLRRRHAGYWQHLVGVDAVIDHSWQKYAYLLKEEGPLKAPVLGVMHAPVNTMYGRTPPVEKPCTVCISKDQADHYNALFSPGEARVAYNGCFEGGTLVYPEGRAPERIDSFVRRRGRERVLAWHRGRLLFALVKKTLKYSPENKYAIRIRTRAGLTLIATPDNPIMTSSGWKSAHLVSIHDEVLCGKTFLDRGGRAPVVGDVADKKQRRDGNFVTTSFVPRNQEPSDQVGGQEEADSVVSEVHIGGTEEHPSYRRGVLGGDHRWGGVRQLEIGSEEVHSRSVLGDSEQRQQNYRLCQEVAADFDVVGVPGTERIGDRPLPSVGMEGICNGSDCREGIGEDHPVHDCQERKGGGSHGFLRDSPQSRVVEQVYGEADTSVSLRSAGELPAWDQVVSVERVSTPAEVFDLTTGSGNFVANGIVVHNCDLDFYKPMGIPRSSRFLFLARFSTIKGPDLAIDACRTVGVGLDLVGDTSITNEPEYFQKCMEKCDRGWMPGGHAFGSFRTDGKTSPDLIRMVGPAKRGECVWWFSQAHCMLHPNMRFREPFGLAPVEAMACGCPVVSWRFGAMPETIKHGETGWLVKSMEELAEAVRNCEVPPKMRERCREWASEFSIDRMVSRYEELCIEAVEGGGW